MIFGVFTFGIGDGASTSLIRNVARASNGKAYFIKDNDNMQAKVIGAMKSSLEDCLTDVTLKWKLQKCFSVVDIPKEPPCIYNGEKLVLFAVAKSSNNTTTISGELSLKGVIGGKTVKHKVNIVGDGIMCEDLPLHRVAAKYQIKDYECDDEGEYSMRESKNKDKIVSISLAANIISKYTAFVGVDKETNLAMSVVQDFKVETVEYASAPLLNRIMHGTCLRMCAAPPPSPPSGAMSCPPPPPPPGAMSCPPAPPPPGAMSCPPAPPPPGAMSCPPHPPPLGAMSCPPAPPPPGAMSCPPVPPPPAAMSCPPPPPPPGSMGFPEQNMEVLSSIVPEKVGLMGIISLQKFDGSWSPSDELQKILNVSLDKLTMKYKGNVWCTAVVLVYIGNIFSEKKVEWEMLAIKAMKWINANNGEGKKAETVIKEVEDSQIL